MKTKYKLIVPFVVSLIALSSCQKQKNTIEKKESDNLSTQVVFEEVMSEENSIVIPEYVGNEILTEDNFEKVIKKIFTLSKEELQDSLITLSELPLTEEFYNECAQNSMKNETPIFNWTYPYEKIELEFWGVREDGKCICICGFYKTDYVLDENADFYYIVMEMQQDRISSIETIWLENYRTDLSVVSRIA